MPARTLTTPTLARPVVNVLVTGGAGFIGSHLVTDLLKRGHRVTVVDNFDPFYDPEAKRRNLAGLSSRESFRLIESDLLHVDRAGIDPGERFDVLVHLAARPGIPASIDAPVLHSRINVGGTAAALELARRVQAHRFVFASSSSVYGQGARVPFAESDSTDRPISPYAAMKRAGELLCHAYHALYGLSVVCLRLFTVYGPRQRPDLVLHRFARHMRAGEPLPVHGDGTARRDYTHVDDVLRGVCGAIEYMERHPGRFEIVNLGAGRPVELRHLIHLLADALGATPRIHHLAPRPGDLSHTWADVGRARELFGYHPSVPLEDGIHSFVEWFRTAHAG